MKNKRKLLYVITSYRAYILIEELIESFTFDFDVYLISSYSKNLENKCKKNGIKYFPTNMKRGYSLIFDLCSFIHSFYLLLKIKPDIINFSTPKASLIYSINSMLIGTKHRIYLIRGFKHEGLKGIRRLIQIFSEIICCKSSTKIIALSQSVLKLAINLKLTDKDKISVIGPGGSGTISKLFYPISKKDKFSLRRSFGIKDHFFIYGFCGRIIPRKGIEELVEAFIQINNLFRDTKLIICGRFEEFQKINPRIFNLIKSHQNIIKVTEMDHRKLVNFYQMLDLFVMPSHGEGFGNVLVEAAMCGIPIVTCKATGTVDAVKEDFNSTLVKIKDIKVLREILLSYKHNNQLCQIHSKNSLIWSAQFDRNKIAIEWQKLYRSLK